jgi:hypothetical protein
MKGKTFINPAAPAIANMSGSYETGHGEGRSLRVKAGRQRLILPDELSASKAKWGNGLPVIRTGVFKGAEICCSASFLKAAEYLLDAIRAKKVFEAEEFYMLPKEVDVGRERPKGCEAFMIVPKELIIEGVEYTPKIVFLSKDVQIGARYHFCITMEGFNENWGIFDLIRAMAEKPLLAEKTVR